MASVVDRGKREYWVQFRYGGKRRTARLGRCGRRAAEEFKRNLEELIALKTPGVRLPPELTAWIERMGEGPHRTLATAGLVAVRESVSRPRRTIGELVSLCQGLVEERVRDGEAKLATLRNAKRTLDNMVEFWGVDYALEDIQPRILKEGPRTTTDGRTAQDFRRWLKESGHHAGGPLMESTTSRRCRRAREFFAEAAEQGWVASNPFRRMRNWKEKCEDRNHYVPIEVIEAAIAQTNDLELRMLLAYARYAGVRGPSEIQTIRLDAFDMERATIRIESPKTEHHDGHEMRWMPFWPAMQRRYLALFEVVKPGSELLFENLGKQSGAALAKRCNKAVQDAGHEPWPRFFVNCRASCETDLLDVHPLPKVCDWIGHSAAVAQKHYSRSKQRRDAHGVEAPAPRWCQIPFVDDVTASASPSAESAKTGEARG